MRNSQRARAIIGAIIAALVFGAVVYAVVDWRRAETAPEVTQPEPSRAPTRALHAVVFTDLVGRPVSEATKMLGLNDKKTTTVIGGPELVAIPEESNVKGLAPDQLRVTAACVREARGESPAVLILGVTPAEDFTSDTENMGKNSPVWRDRLVELGNCSPTRYGLDVFE